MLGFCLGEFLGTIYFLLFCLEMPNFKPKALLVLDKHSTTELHCQPRTGVGSSKVPLITRLKWVSGTWFLLGWVLSLLFSLFVSNFTKGRQDLEITNTLEKSSLAPLFSMYIFIWGYLCGRCTLSCVYTCMQIPVHRSLASVGRHQPFLPFCGWSLHFLPIIVEGSVCNSTTLTYYSLKIFLERGSLIEPGA